MSIIVSDSKSIVTINGSVRKMVSGINVAGIIRSILPPELSESDIIRTRSIKLSYEMAHNAVTGHKSPIAFVQGFAFCVTAFSHGNKNLTQLSENAPEWARFALEHACSMFKAGAGNITAESLIAAVGSAVKAVLACPAPESKKAITKPSPVIIDSTSTRVDDESIDAEKVNRQADKADEKAADNLASATTEHAEKIAAENKAAAEKAAAEKASQEDVDIVRIVQAFAINRPEFALQQLQDAAALLGYRLTRIPTKKAA